MKKYYVAPLSEDVFASPLMDDYDAMLGSTAAASISNQEYNGGGN